MTTLREAAQQALEALEDRNDPQGMKALPAMTALRAALAEPVEPVAWLNTKDRFTTLDAPSEDYDIMSEWVPLYVAPPQRKPLTDEEAKAISRVGPVYAPDGVVTRTPTAYRQELEQTRMDAIRRTEAAHGIGGKA
jgi:hypothetical protein